MHVPLAAIKLLLALVRPHALNKKLISKTLIITSGKTKHEKNIII